MSADTIQEQTSTALPPPEKEAGSARLIATLGIAGFLSGLVLVGAYLYTLPIIQANRAQALQAAIYRVLPGCARYEALELRDGRLVDADMTAAAGKGPAPRRIFAGYGEREQLLGFAVPAEEPGFQDLIAGIFGYDPGRKTIVGFEVLDSKETPGLGDKIFKDTAFQAHFRELAVEPAIVAVKRGERRNPNEVEAITGATISSKTVVRLLDKGVAAWRPAIEAYLDEQPDH